VQRRGVSGFEEECSPVPGFTQRSTQRNNEYGKFMISITYASSATQRFSEEDLKALLIKARDNNTKLGITGLLLYKDGNFMQTVEGPEEAVHELYKKINADPRHGHILKLLEYEITERSFSTWEMGFRNLSGPDVKEIPGYSEFLQTPLTSPFFQTNPTKAQKLLLMFREIVR
jgi:lipopolysaccharide biosynthesis regulator YciM